MLHGKKGTKEGEEGMWGGGGGVGDRLESPVETHSIFVVVFCMCSCFLQFGGGDGKLLI